MQVHVLPFFTMPFAMKAMKASDSASGATDSENHHEVWLRGQGQCSSGDGSSLPWCPQTSMHKENAEHGSVKRPPDDWQDPMSKDEAWQEATPLKKRIKLKLDNDLLRGGGGKADKKKHSQF